MEITPVRAFALGAGNVLLIAGAFAAGIGVASQSTSSDSVAAPDGVVTGDAACPTPPGFTATKAENDRARSCEQAASIRELLLGSGAIDADVRVDQRPSTSLLGPETEAVVTARVILPEGVRAAWDPERAAAAVARHLDTAQSNVTILDDRLAIVAPAPRAVPAPRTFPQSM